MNRRAMLSLAVIITLGLLHPSDTQAQGKKKSVKSMPSQEEMMKRWQAYMTPGEAHKKLETMAGTWDAEIKVWMNGPDGEPAISKGTAEQKMSLGGRYLQQTVASEMMGQPFTGTGYTGYDNFKEKYLGFWIDDMGTGMTTMEGSIDKAGKTLTMWGVMDEPTTGERNKKVKYVTHLIDTDKHVFEIFDVSTYGDKKPTMQITYTRKK
jgi:hypothetical protein